MFSHPVPVYLRERLQAVFQNDLGHGLFHSMHVSLDTATLICVEIESNGMNEAPIERLMLLGLLAGLLHDICRNEDSHAEAGALEAARILEDYPLEAEEIECILLAIKNHEAFVAPQPCKRSWEQLVSDCLYDADKFRWGADTFTHTLWHMADHHGFGPRELVERFPWGMTGVMKIIETFRTATGREFGPEIIETGMAIGKEIYRYLLQHLREDLYEK